MTITPLALALRENQSVELSWIQEDGNFSAIQTAVNALIGESSGQMVAEGPFFSGIGFTPGTTTTLTLSQSYVSPQNLWVFFDAGYQGFDTYIISGATIVFNNPIPVGTSEVFIVGGTILPINAPAVNSVGINQLQASVLNFFTQVSVLASSSGSSSIGYNQGSTGAATITQQAKNQQIVSVMDFGATGNGSTDDTAAIQAAINAVQGTNVTLWFPHGTYLISSTLNITNSISCISQSQGSAAITWLSTTLNAISIITNAICAFENLTFIAPTGATADAIITLAGLSGNGNSFSYFRRCSFYNGWNQLNTVSASNWTVDACIFGGFLNSGISVADTMNVDAGDSYIGGNSNFAPGNNTAISILQYSSGGLKIEGNKCIGGAYFYQLSLPASGSISTSDLIIVGNSIEGQLNGGILLNKPSGGTLTFANVVISDNQIAAVGSTYSGSYNAISTDSTSTGWLSRVTINDNQITLPPSSGSPTFIGINIGSAVADFMSTGNLIYAQAGSGAPVNYGIAVNAAVASGVVGPNKFSGTTWTAKIGNNSTAVTVVPNTFIPATSTATFNTSTASGSVYAGSIVVTFATAFDAIPVVECTPEGLTSPISAFPSGISKTGFTLNAVSSASLTAQTAKWTARGTT